MVTQASCLPESHPEGRYQEESICVENQQCHCLTERTVKEERRWKERNGGGARRERQGEGIRHVAGLDRVHRGCTNTEMGKDIN